MIKYKIGDKIEMVPVDSSTLNIVGIIMDIDLYQNCNTTIIKGNTAPNKTTDYAVSILWNYNTHPVAYLKDYIDEQLNSITMRIVMRAPKFIVKWADALNKLDAKERTKDET